MKKRILALGLTLALAATMLAGCGSKSSGKAAVPEIELNEKSATDMKPDFDESGFAEVADNDRFELYVQEEGAGIKVVDKDTGKEWMSSASAFDYAEDFDSADPVEPTAYGPEDRPKYAVNNKWQQKLNSIFEIFYTNRVTGYGAVINLSLLEMDYTVEYKQIENGVRVLYDLQNASIKLALDFSLSDRGLVVEVPQECIEENGDYDITSLKIMPYFADALDSNNGYYFYPDGSGAIMEFKDSAHYLETELALTVYGDILKYKNMLSVFDEEDPSVTLPVFGANINDNGFIGIIEEGEEVAKIKVNPTNSVIPTNALYAEFQFRRSFSDARIAGSGVMTFDQKLIESQRKIEYIFLDEGKSTYSDMAVAYRDYLMNDCGVTEKAETDAIPLSLDLFMGIYEEGMLFDTFKTVTTFDQSQTILKALKDEGVDDIQLQLKGWTHGGYFRDPEMFPPNGKFGGKSGLKKLSSYAEENGVQLSLETNLMEANAKAGGYSERKDVVYLGNKTIFQNGDISIMSPSTARKNADDFLEEAAKYDIDGVSYYALGEYVPYNYNADDYITQGQAADIWQDIFQTTKDKDLFVSVQGGNSYVLPYADKITDLTYKDSGYLLTTKSVPFYQIAVHGLTEYTGQAANLSSDLEKEKLKWVEFGYIPYFELTYSGSEDLMYTNYAELFSSEYTSWIDEASEIYQEFNENLKDVWNALITSHEEVKTDVFKVTYDNGKVVYVNYNDEDVVVDGVTVNAMDYVVK